MSHSIDFHASQTAMNHQMVEIKPGETFTYTFTADYAGVWMYHCGTAPALHHIANGMFGMVIVEPKGGLPKVDKRVRLRPERVVPRRPGRAGRLREGQPDGRRRPTSSSSTGSPTSTRTTRSRSTTGGRVRVFVLDAGPNIDSSFHVVGTIFDTVTKEGIQLLPGNAGGWGSQAVDLSPAQGAIIEFTPAEDGMYPFVTHAFNFVGARCDRDLRGRRRRPQELASSPASSPAVTFPGRPPVNHVRRVDAGGAPSGAASAGRRRPIRARATYRRSGSGRSTSSPRHIEISSVDRRPK